MKQGFYKIMVRFSLVACQESISSTFYTLIFRSKANWAAFYCYVSAFILCIFIFKRDMQLFSGRRKYKYEFHFVWTNGEPRHSFSSLFIIDVTTNMFQHFGPQIMNWQKKSQFFFNLLQFFTIFLLFLIIYYHFLPFFTIFYYFFYYFLLEKFWPVFP